MTAFWGILLTEEEKKEEITVKAPTKSVTAPEKTAQKEIEKEFEEERYGVLQVPKKTGILIGAYSIFAGALLFFFLTYMSLTGQVSGMFSSSGPLWVLGVWLTVGVISIVAGFLLMGSDL